ncbi:anthranilate synthase component 1 [Aspergillus udagawae]|uniref:Anthranilate synthase component 1 n=1 Tax=Aspergillus udagawae TaxID=91492 RepID=A0A8H3N054_9EURO|nr:anthranilate synthase component 1 [Aspergillus udagawae]
MAHPDLTSHHVNYLIWRYLQESGHGEAAVTLQRAWNHDPQSLPFAPYIRTHALDGNPTPFTPSKYFFGPVPLEIETQKGQAGPEEAGTGTDQAADSSTSKAAREGGVSNGHPTAEAGGPQLPPATVKKARKSDRGEVNGDEVPMDVDTNGVGTEKKPTVAASPSPAQMNVDGDGDVNMDVPPNLQEQEPAAAPTFTLTTGHSVGVQISPAKAADLSPNTTILNVAGGDHVTRTLWRPNDPTTVLAAGDTFCSLWRLQSTSSGPVQEKLVESRGDGNCVSAVAWHPKGHKFAVATYNDMRGSITMYDVAGNAVDLLPEVPRMITGLHWADNSSHLIVVASDSKISELAIWDDSLRPDEFPSPQVVDGSIFDLSWLGHKQAYASGHGVVYQCDVDSSIRIAKTFSWGDSDRVWSFVRCANAGSSPVAVAASSDTAAFWVPTHDMHLDGAHQGDITSIEIRPRPESAEKTQLDHSVVLASASTDDTVKIWQIDLEAKRFICLHRLVLGQSMPALAACFSPDGYAVAAASRDRLFIWNAERGGTAMATWAVSGSDKAKSEGEADHAVNGQNGGVESLPDRSLSWDTDGKKLAFGFAKQLMIAYLVSNGDDCRLTSLLPHPAISEHRWSPTVYARPFTALLKVHDQAVRCITTSGYHNFKLDCWRQFMSIHFTLCKFVFEPPMTSEAIRGAVLLGVFELLSLSTFHSQPAFSFSYAICFFDVSPSPRPSAYTFEKCPDSLLVTFFRLTSRPLPSPTFMRPGRDYLIMLFLPSFNPADQPIYCTLKPFTLRRLFPEFLLPARESEWSIRGNRYAPCHSSNFPATKIINMPRLFSAFLELFTKFGDFTEDACQLLGRCLFCAGISNIGIIMTNAWNIGSNDFRTFRADTFGTALGNFLGQSCA